MLSLKALEYSSDFPHQKLMAPHHYWFEVTVFGFELGVCLFIFSIRSSAPGEEVP